MRNFFQYFRLPTESQQVERIITPFALAYTAHNKKDFPGLNAETLALSVLFLNTVKHTKSVKPFDREFYIKQLRDEKLGYPHFSPEDLGLIYDRVSAEAFKTDTQRIERIYQRLGAFLNY